MSFATDFRSIRTAIDAPLNERLAFLRKTYMILLVAVLAFAALSGVFVAIGVGEMLLGVLGSSWIFMIGGLMIVAWIAQAMSSPEKSLGTQIAGLSIYTVGEALFFSPIFFLVTTYDQFQGILLPASAVTLLIFGGLTFYVLTTRKDFSFLRGALVVLSFAALALIILSFAFGLSLGAWFSVAMVVLAAGMILYDTSNVLHHYRTDQAFGAALSLFASVLLLFWYVLRLFMAARD